MLYFLVFNQFLRSDHILLILADLSLELKFGIFQELFKLLCNRFNFLWEWLLLFELLQVLGVDPLNELNCVLWHRDTCKV